MTTQTTTTTTNESEPEADEQGTELAISEFADSLGDASFKQYIYTKTAKEWECNGIYDDRVHLLSDIAIEHGPGKHKVVIRHKTGELDKAGKPKWGTFTRVFVIGPHFRKAHQDYLRDAGLLPEDKNQRQGGLFEMLDVAKLKDLATFFVGLKSIMSGGNPGTEYREVIQANQQFQNQIITGLLQKPSTGINDAILIELIKNRGNDNSSMEKMFEAFKEGISIGKESGGDEGGPMDRMVEAMAPALATSLLGAGGGVPMVQEQLEAPRVAIEPPRAAARPKLAASANPNDVAAIIAQLKNNPKLAAAAYNQVKSKHGKAKADELARAYGIPITTKATNPQKGLKVI